MKAYFTASIVARQTYLEDYKSIVRELEENGYKVQADHILYSDVEKIRSSKRNERQKFHSQVERWIKGADIVVANTSFPSISVGYEIAMALQQNKPVLVLHRVGTKAPNLLNDYKSDSFVCEAYSPAALPELIREFVTFAKSRVEMRFTFFLTPSQAAHLAVMAKKHSVPKSVYLRSLIEKDISLKPKSPPTSR